MRLLDVEEALQPGLREDLRLARVDRLIRWIWPVREARLDAAVRSHEPDHRVRIEPNRRGLRAAQDVPRPLGYLDHTVRVLP